VAVLTVPSVVFCVLLLFTTIELSRTSARASLCLDLTDFVPPEDWGPDYPPGTVRTVPIPTIYNMDGLKTKPKLGIVEFVLYNIAAMLAGVASGYDVRLSNVSPVHPRLQPHR
ncbi:hypothetical protein Trydic_g12120, partial [Trypoxylus dichotomus]